MSFSNRVKNEASKVNIISSKLMLAELSAFVRTCSDISFDNEGLILEFITENASTARRIYTHSKNFTSYIQAERIKSKSLNKNSNYHIIIKDSYAIDDLLFDTDFVKNHEYEKKNYRINSHIVQTEEEIRAFLRGAFLGAGSVTNPEKAYHLELIAKDEGLANDIKDLLLARGLNAKVTERKSNYIVYIKEAEHISDFMAMIGANQGLFKFENVRVLKDLRNNVNRVVNCETANINKLITASMKQKQDIECIRDSGKFEDMPKDWQEVALLRLENENYSLKEIAELSEGKYSRSGINYRLKKIGQLADKLRSANNERNES